MLDVSQVIESYKGQKCYKYLMELDTLYRHLKMCKPHPFDYDWREAMIKGRGCGFEYYKRDSALSHLLMLARFKMYMQEGNFLNALQEIEDIFHHEIDILREDVYHVTIDTIEEELCHLREEKYIQG